MANDKINDWEDVPLSDISDWEDVENVSDIESGVRGAIQGATLGFDDEIKGGFEALGQAVGIKGLGADDFSSLGLQEPNLNLKQVYEATRDSTRK